MTPAFQASTETTLASGTSWVVNAPAGVASGDLLVAVLAQAFTPGTITPPAGWTASATITGDPYLQSFWKIAGGSEPSTYTFTLGNARAGTAVISRFTGTDVSAPINVTTGAQQNGSVANPFVLPDVSPTVDGTLYFAALCIDENALTVDWSSAPGGATNRYDYSANNNLRQQGYTEPISAAGATGTRSFDINNTIRPRAGLALLLAPTTLSPSGIASAEAFGTPVVAGPVTVAGIASAEALGTPTVSFPPQTVSPSGIATAEALGTAAVTAPTPNPLNRWYPTTDGTLIAAVTTTPPVVNYEATIDELLDDPTALYGIAVTAADHVLAEDPAHGYSYPGYLGINYAQVGTAPDRVLAVTFDLPFYAGNETDAQHVTAQAQLHEDGTIELHYARFAINPADPISSLTIGLWWRDSTGADRTLLGEIAGRTFNAEWPATPIPDEQAVRFTPAGDDWSQAPCAFNWIDTDPSE